jgi:hypothetical protein
MVFQLTEVPREGHVLGTRDVLVTEEQHAVLQQQAADLGHQRRVTRGRAQVHVAQLGTERAAQRLDDERPAQRRGLHEGGRHGGGGG